MSAALAGTISHWLGSVAMCTCAEASKRKAIELAGEGQLFAKRVVAAVYW